MDSTWKEKVWRYSTMVLVLLIVVGGIVLAWPTYQSSCDLRRRDAELSRLIDLKRAEIAKLKENQIRFRKDPEFVEMIARRHRRVFPGEVVFIFKD